MPLLLLLCAGGFGVQAQESAPAGSAELRVLRLSSDLRESELSAAAASRDDYGGSLGIVVRHNVLRGKVFDHSFPGVPRLDWEDFFTAGFGGGVEMSGTVPYYGHRVGFFASLIADVYPGDKVSLGAGELELDPLVAVSVIAGPRADLLLGNHFFLGTRVGVGVVLYNDVEIRSPGSSLPFFESSANVLVDAALRAGWGTSSFSFAIGGGIRYQGGPSLDGGGRSEALQVVSLELLFEFRF